MILEKRTDPKPYPEEIPRMLDMWRQIYRFYFTFRHMENTQEAWSRCWTAACGILHMFNDDPLAKKLIYAITEWIEDRIKAEYAR